jgi:ribonuclease HI
MAKDKANEIANKQKFNYENMNKSNYKISKEETKDSLTLIVIENKKLSKFIVEVHPLKLKKKEIDSKKKIDSKKESNKEIDSKKESKKIVKKSKDVVNHGLPGNGIKFDIDSSVFYDLSILYCDGACNKDTGDSAWGSVVNKESVDLIPFYKNLLEDLKYEKKELKINNVKVERELIICKATDVKKQQNNYAELLSFVFSLKIAQKSEEVKEIKSDSDLIILYWSNPNHNTTMTRDENKNKYILLSKKLRLAFENNGGIITKIAGKNNLADMGKHKG